MKVISTVINPIPDEEGYHIFQCDECQKLFLVKPLDMEEDEQLYCPYCGVQGGVFSFTKGIREKFFNDYPNSLGAEVDDTINKEIDIEQIKDILKNITKENMDVQLLEYTINEITNSEDLIKYEMICCDKSIKIPMDIYKTVNYCSFCKGEILLNITE